MDNVAAGPRGADRRRRRTLLVVAASVATTIVALITAGILLSPQYSAVQATRAFASGDGTATLQYVDADSVAEGLLGQVESLMPTPTTRAEIVETNRAKERLSALHPFLGELLRKGIRAASVAYAKQARSAGATETRAAQERTSKNITTSFAMRDLTTCDVIVRPKEGGDIASELSKVSIPAKMAEVTLRMNLRGSRWVVTEARFSRETLDFGRAFVGPFLAENLGASSVGDLPGLLSGLMSGTPPPTEPPTVPEEAPSPAPSEQATAPGAPPLPKSGTPVATPPEGSAERQAISEGLMTSLGGDTGPSYVFEKLYVQGDYAVAKVKGGQPAEELLVGMWKRDGTWEAPYVGSWTEATQELVSDWNFPPSLTDRLGLPAE